MARDPHDQNAAREHLTLTLTPRNASKRAQPSCHLAGRVLTAPGKASARILASARKVGAGALSAAGKLDAGPESGAGHFVQELHRPIAAETRGSGTRGSTGC
jgi:hypothetical protein